MLSKSDRKELKIRNSYMKYLTVRHLQLLISIRSQLLTHSYSLAIRRENKIKNNNIHR